MNNPTPPRLAPVLQALLVTFLWSTSWILIKLGLVDIPLVTVVSIGAGSLALSALALAVEEWPRLDSRSWAIILWLAVVNTAFAFTLWNHTLRRLLAVLGALAVQVKMPTRPAPGSKTEDSTFEPNPACQPGARMRSSVRP